MVSVPAETPVTTPLLLTVATPVLPLDHVPVAEFPLTLNVVVLPPQIVCVPASVPATGAADTVTVRVAVALQLLALVPVTV